jgi:hypothetical protein
MLLKGLVLFWQRVFAARLPAMSTSGRLDPDMEQAIRNSMLPSTQDGVASSEWDQDLAVRTICMRQIQERIVFRFDI